MNGAQASKALKAQGGKATLVAFSLVAVTLYVYGMLSASVITLADVEMVALSEAGLPASVDASDRLNYGTFYRPDAWVVAKRPVEVRTLLGRKRVRAVGISLDAPKAFAACVAAAGK